MAPGNRLSDPLGTKDYTFAELILDLLVISVGEEGTFSIRFGEDLKCAALYHRYHQTPVVDDKSLDFSTLLTILRKVEQNGHSPNHRDFLCENGVHVILRLSKLFLLYLGLWFRRILGLHCILRMLR